MKTRRLSDFVSEQSGKGVKLDRLTPSPTVDVATLRQADLDGNGWLSGAAEMKAAFARADAFDRDGNAQTLVSEDAQGLKTRAGQLLDAVTANAVAGAPLITTLVIVMINLLGPMVTSVLVGNFSPPNTL